MSKIRKKTTSDVRNKINSNNYGTVAKQEFGNGYEDVYEALIRKDILHSIDDNHARLAIPKETLDDKLKDFLLCLSGF